MKTDVRGPHVAYENFCLCSLQPEWTQNPNWQQGFCTVRVEDNGFFHEFSEKRAYPLGFNIVFYLMTH